MKIIDNLFDKDFLDSINDQIKHLRYVPHGSRDDLNFFYSDGLIDERFWQFVFDKILDKTNLEERHCNRIYVNCYPYGIEGDWHRDNEVSTFEPGSTQKTLIFYPKPWKKQYKGATAFENEKVEYKENRLLIFDSNLLHKAEKHYNQNMRYTLAFKVGIK